MVSAFIRWSFMTMTLRPVGFQSRFLTHPVLKNSQSALSTPTYTNDKPTVTFGGVPRALKSRWLWIPATFAASVSYVITGLTGPPPIPNLFEGPRTATVKDLRDCETGESVKDSTLEITDRIPDKVQDLDPEITMASLSTGTPPTPSTPSTTPGVPKEILQAMIARYSMGQNATGIYGILNKQHQIDFIETIGPMQVPFPIAEKMGYTREQLCDPAASILAGARHLKSLYDQKGNWTDAVYEYQRPRKSLSGPLEDAFPGTREDVQDKALDIIQLARDFGWEDS
jgi:hypothetical protein